MSLSSLSQLDKFASQQSLGLNDPRTFFSPVDNVHDALVSLLMSTATSLVVAMYGFDDQVLANIIKSKLQNQNVFVQLTLDSSQAAGAVEKTILTGEQYPTSSLAIGRSEDGAIMHLKMVIIDGLDVVTGSTNWSTGGETKQDNQLTVIRDAVFAARCRSRIDAIHANMLNKQKSST